MATTTVIEAVTDTDFLVVLLKAPTLGRMPLLSGPDSPISWAVHEALGQTARAMMRSHDIDLGYVWYDQIVLVFTPIAGTTRRRLYAGRLTKLASRLAAEATTRFQTAIEAILRRSAGWTGRAIALFNVWSTYGPSLPTDPVWRRVMVWQGKHAGGGYTLEQPEAWTPAKFRGFGASVFTLPDVAAVFADFDDRWNRCRVSTMARFVAAQGISIDGLGYNDLLTALPEARFLSRRLSGGSLFVNLPRHGGDIEESDTPYLACHDYDASRQRFFYRHCRKQGCPCQCSAEPTRPSEPV